VIDLVVAHGRRVHDPPGVRLRSTSATMPRLPRRRLLLTILEDVSSGAYSALERRYLAAVERPHGLPTADRQRRVRSGRTVAYRDVEYVGLGVVTELDGRLGHEKATDRWADLERDVESVIGGDLTLRIGWRQVLSPCRLAGVLDRVLTARGWTGPVTPCGPDCGLADPDLRNHPARDWAARARSSTPRASSSGRSVARSRWKP
jgi:hypothetical protein